MIDGVEWGCDFFVFEIFYIVFDDFGIVVGNEGECGIGVEFGGVVVEVIEEN